MYVVVLTYGGKSWLERFLPSLFATDYPDFRVWVIDNGSQPPLIDWIEARFPQVKALRYAENTGYAGGYQRFFSEHGSEVPYLALLNDDVEVTPSWLRVLVERMERCTDLAAVQPKVLAWRQRNLFEYAGAAGGFLDVLGYPTCRGRDEADQAQYEIPSQVFWAGGAAFLLRTKAIAESLQGMLFKSYYFMHMEEIDLCWRLQRAGWKVGYEPASVVYHVGGASLSHAHARKTFYNFRNSLFLLWENLSGWERYLRVALRLVLDAPAALYLLIKGGPSHVAAIACAHWSFFGYIARKKLNICAYLPFLPYRQLKGIASLPTLSGKRKYPYLPLVC